MDALPHGYRQENASQQNNQKDHIRGTSTATIARGHQPGPVTEIVPGLIWLLLVPRLDSVNELFLAGMTCFSMPSLSQSYPRRRARYRYPLHLLLGFAE